MVCEEIEGGFSSPDLIVLHILLMHQTVDASGSRESFLIRSCEATSSGFLSLFIGAIGSFHLSSALMRYVLQEMWMLVQHREPILFFSVPVMFQQISCCSS